MCPLPKKSSVIAVVLYSVIFLAVLAIDIISKLVITNNFPVGRTVPIIDGVIHLTYVRNTGAAFGIFDNSTIFLTVLSIIIVLIVFGAMVYYKPKDMLIRLSVCLICAGAVGNIIDRIRYGFVVDFIDVRIINFAVFNIADCFICIGVFLLVMYILFHRDEPEEIND